MTPEASRLLLAFPGQVKAPPGALSIPPPRGGRQSQANPSRGGFQIPPPRGGGALESIATRAGLDLATARRAAMDLVLEGFVTVDGKVGGSVTPLSWIQLTGAGRAIRYQLLQSLETAANAQSDSLSPFAHRLLQAMASGQLRTLRYWGHVAGLSELRLREAAKELLQKNRIDQVNSGADDDLLHRLTFIKVPRSSSRGSRSA